MALRCFAQEKLVTRNLVFAHRAGFGEREIEAEALADEKFEPLTPNRKAARRGGFFAGYDRGEFGESARGGLEKGGKPAGVFRKPRQFGFESFQKLHRALARLFSEFDPERLGSLHAVRPCAEEFRDLGEARLDGREDLGGIFPRANEEFENGIDRRAGVGLRVDAPTPEVAKAKCERLMESMEQIAGGSPGMLQTLHQAANT